MNEDKVFEVSKEQLKKKENIKKAMIEQMKDNGTYKEPYSDMVDRYISMWKICIMLEADISLRGVKTVTDKGVKKNDSVAMLTNMNKQMLICLDKLGLSTANIKGDLGGDI